MNNLGRPGFARLMSILRTVPPWVLAGLALACCAILYAPEVGIVDAMFITFGVLAAAKIMDLIVAGYLIDRRRRAAAYRLQRLNGVAPLDAKPTARAGKKS